MKTTKQFLMLCCLMVMAAWAYGQQWELDFGDQNDINQHSRIDMGMIDANEDAVLIGRFGRRRDWNTQLIKVHPDGSYERRVCEDLPKRLFMKDLVQLDNGNYFTVAFLQQDTTAYYYGGSELW